MAEFRAWPKIARLNREVVITEKIDGTNAAVIIVPWKDLVIKVSEGYNWTEDYYRQWSGQNDYLLAVVGTPVTVERGGHTWVEYREDSFGVFAQSRTRMINPQKDNYGFAKWVQDNAETLVADLGAGYHYGEWWGQGIQRKYGMDHKRFSLFNTTRWTPEEETGFTTPNLHVVPVLYRGDFDTWDVEDVLADLRERGSFAAPGFMKPEGIVIYHTASNTLFKVTCENDSEPKSKAVAA